MAAKRLAALVGAVLLIVGAVALRGFLDDGGSVAVGREGAPVVCDPLVIEACEEAFPDVDVTEEDPGVTLDRLLDERNPEPFVWVTAQVWFDILDVEIARQGRGSSPVGDTTAVAESNRVLVTGIGVEICEQEEQWSCLAAGEGDVSKLDIGLDGPDSTMGVLTRGDLASGFFGGTDFASNDFATPGFRTWWNQVGERLEPAQRKSSLDDLIVTQGRIDVAVSVQAVWGQVTREGYAAVSPSDGEQVVVIGAGAIGDARVETDELVDLMREQGWQAAGPGSIRPADAVSPGVLQALRQL